MIDGMNKEQILESITDREVHPLLKGKERRVISPEKLAEFFSKYVLLKTSLTTTETGRCEEITEGFSEAVSCHHRLPCPIHTK